MKRYIEIEALCPFVQRPCIKDGWQWNQKITRPCMFYDETSSLDDKEPCMILRAVETIIGKKETTNDGTVDVPWDVVEEGMTDNGRT